MTAVVGVLNESLSESIKGFYKLRRAYTTLDTILAAEARYVGQRQRLGTNAPVGRSIESFSSHTSGRSNAGMPGGFEGGSSSIEPSRLSSEHAGATSGSQSQPAQSKRSENPDMSLSNGEADEDEFEFFDAEEDRKEDLMDSYTGHLDSESSKDTTHSVEGGEEESNDMPRMQLKRAVSEHYGILDHDPGSETFSEPVDVFIHSAANLCFGMLNIMISMIPPTFAKLLYIIGFHGDKERGIRMLWQASKFPNVNGAFAGLIVLGYYNTFVGFSDIVPESDPNVAEMDQVDGYPKKRCEALLADMRRRHPKSQLWLLEEARLNALNKRLSTSISLLEGISSPQSPPSKLKQVAALIMFEKALDAMYSHRLELCSASFLSSLSLNNWSPSLYTYIAGCAHLEMYRQLQPTNPAEAKKHAAKATELIRDAPNHAGKKKFMARQLPFDVFVARKVRKWEARATELNAPLVDAVGVSPIEEMIFFWNGYKRMNESQLEDSLVRLAWSESQPSWVKETRDERAILAVLRAATMRNLGHLDKAEKVLKGEVLNVDKAELKGGLKDDWTAPAAHYEMGAICWTRRLRVQAAQNGGPTQGVKEGATTGSSGGKEDEERWVDECAAWVDKAARWESYDLDARFGVKIATAQDTLKRWKEKNGRKGK